MLEVEVNGTRLAYTERGSGQPVLFVHGGLADLRVWDKQLEAFSGEYRALAVSCRHYFPNEKIREGVALDLEAHVDDLGAFVRALDLAPLHLVGHSSPGAFGSLLLARQQPELLRTLVLAEPPALPVLGVNVPPKVGQVVRLALRSPGTAAAIVRFGMRGIGPASRAFARGEDERGVEAFLKGNAGPAAYARLSEDMRQRMLENVGPLKAQLRAGFPRLEAGDVRAVDIPILLISGEESPLVLRRITDRLERLLPDVERVDIADASHGMFVEQPEAFNRAVLAFLEKHKN